MIYNIWIDDMRPAPSKDNLVVFKNAEDAIKWFEKADEILNSDIFHFWLDHDLGSRKSGYDFAKWFIEWNMETKIPMSFHLLTANPVGAFNIRQLFTHYGYSEF